MPGPRHHLRTSSCVCSHNAYGGIFQVASSCSTDVNASMSYCSNAFTYRARSARCCSSSSAGRAAALTSFDASVARARCSALFTAATLVPRSSATSSACQRNTSRRMRTARCFAGRCCSAATKARRTDSLAIAASTGSLVADTTRESGIGSIHIVSSSGVPSGASALRAGPRSIGRARRWLAPFMSRHTFVAMRYSQERNDERPSNASNPRQARTNASWTASSASNAEPSMR